VNPKPSRPEQPRCPAARRNGVSLRPNNSGRSTSPPRFIVQPDLQAGRLLQVLPEARPTADEIHALYPRSHRASVKIQALCDFLQQALHAAAWTTDGAR